MHTEDTVANCKSLEEVQVYMTLGATWRLMLTYNGLTAKGNPSKKYWFLTGNGPKPVLSGHAKQGKFPKITDLGGKTFDAMMKTVKAKMAKGYKVMPLGYNSAMVGDYL